MQSYSSAVPMTESYFFDSLYSYTADPGEMPYMLGPEAEGYSDTLKVDPHEIALHLGRRLHHSHTRISELEQELQLDQQTGLLNHRTWHKLVDEFIDSGIEDLGVIFIDMSNLKVVNDRLGHKLGDQLIDETATILSSKLRATENSGFSDLVSFNPDEPEHSAGRLGGDEFGILCDLAPRADAPGKESLPLDVRMQILKNRLRDGFNGMLASHPLNRDLRKYGFDIAIGGAIWRPGMTSTTLLKEADDDMYRDKQSHKQNLLSLEERDQLRVVRHLLERVGVRTEFLDE